MKFIGAFTYWLSTAKKNMTDAIARSINSLEEAISKLDSSGKPDEANNLREDREELINRAEIEAAKAYLEEFQTQYGEVFVKKMIALADDPKFVEFFYDISASENMKTITIDQHLEPAKRKHDAKARADRATGCMIPLEIMQSVSKKNKQVLEFNSEIDE